MPISQSHFPPCLPLPNATSLLTFYYCPRGQLINRVNTKIQNKSPGWKGWKNIYFGLSSAWTVVSEVQPTERGKSVHIIWAFMLGNIFINCFINSHFLRNIRVTVLYIGDHSLVCWSVCQQHTKTIMLDESVKFQIMFTCNISVNWIPLSPMFPLSCAGAQLRIAGTVSAHRKPAQKKSNLNWN